MKNKKQFYALMTELTFIPQVLLATGFYAKLKYDSAVLLDGKLRSGLFLSLLEIVAFSVLTLPKRWLPTRFLLIGAYLQLLSVVILRRFTNGTLKMFGREFRAHYFLIGFIVFGITLTVVNIIALKKYRQEELNEKDARQLNKEN